ncbi:hypothetical protein LguiA_017726 [Lonicera macranthoides]
MPVGLLHFVIGPCRWDGTGLCHQAISLGRTIAATCKATSRGSALGCTIYDLNYLYKRDNLSMGNSPKYTVEYVEQS